MNAAVRTFSESTLLSASRFMGKACVALRRGDVKSAVDCIDMANSRIHNALRVMHLEDLVAREAMDEAAAEIAALRKAIEEVPSSVPSLQAARETPLLPASNTTTNRKG